MDWLSRHGMALQGVEQSGDGWLGRSGVVSPSPVGIYLVEQARQGLPKQGAVRSGADRQARMAGAGRGLARCGRGLARCGLAGQARRDRVRRVQGRTECGAFRQARTGKAWTSQARYGRAGTEVKGWHRIDADCIGTD